MAGVLFEDIFNVKDIDPEGKKFDRGIVIYFVIFNRLTFFRLYFETHFNNYI